jgi:iron complex outermembrane receptor protein
MGGMPRISRRRSAGRYWLVSRPAALACLAAVFIPSPALGQSAGTTQGAPTATQQPVGRFKLPPIIVTAQKEPADAQTLPVSLTTVSDTAIATAGATTVREAAIYAPNVIFTDFTARKLSNPRFRGIGASPANPAVTTYFDGVPQLHANASNLELLAVEQIEFVRGPQSALFGRNALGGLIHVATARPSLGGWGGAVTAPLGNHDARDVRASASGPLADNRLGFGVSLQYGRRDGYTRNEITGNRMDEREAFAGKAQLLWRAADIWETRLIVSGERARDGDYALSDLAGLRQAPFRTARDFEGHTHRDVLATTLISRREGARVTLSTTTGFVRWRTDDSTDLDYSPLPLATRDNAEEAFQFTQEVRLASAPNARVGMTGGAALAWQTGVFFFTQNYDQEAVNAFSPFVLSPMLTVPVVQTSPLAALDDMGVGVYGQGTLTFAERVDASAGIRVDYERKQADLGTSFSPQIFPGRDVRAEEGFSNVSPQLALAVRLQPQKMVYASVTRGFKAGGFNAASPAGRESYGEEHTWGLEGGLKTMWAAGRVRANLSVFRIDWDDLQLNVPDPTTFGQFFIANVGTATSTGVELDMIARMHPLVDVFSAIGLTRARFGDESVANGVNVGNNRIPFTPDYTATVGTQVTGDVRSGLSLYGRAEVTVHGAFHYDEANTARQEGYSLANFRLGVRGQLLFVEGWIRNAFDTRYIPVALPLVFAPSGFVGEMGAPRTFGVTTGVTY